MENDREYKISFFTGESLDDGCTFGCSTADFASAEGWGDLVKDCAVWSIRPRGTVLNGTYGQVLESLRTVLTQGYRSDAAVLFFVKNEGHEQFLAQFSALMGSIPFCGGGASPIKDGSSARLIPSAEEVGLLLIRDNRYQWSSDWRNFHADISKRVFVRLASPRVILSVRPEGANRDIPAQEWYKNLQKANGIPEDCFERIALSTEDGYNLHLSPEGKIELRSGADIPPSGVLAVRILDPSMFQENISRYCEKTNALICGCAGLRGQIRRPFPIGGATLAGFLHGEILNAQGSHRFANLMASTLIAER